MLTYMTGTGYSCGHGRYLTAITKLTTQHDTQTCEQVIKIQSVEYYNVDGAGCYEKFTGKCSDYVGKTAFGNKNKSPKLYCLPILIVNTPTMANFNANPLIMELGREVHNQLSHTGTSQLRQTTGNAS